MSEEFIQPRFESDRRSSLSNEKRKIDDSRTPQHQPQQGISSVTVLGNISTGGSCKDRQMEYPTHQ